MQIIIVLAVYIQVYCIIITIKQWQYTHILHIVGMCPFWDHIDDIGLVIENWNGFCDV